MRPIVGRRAVSPTAIDFLTGCSIAVGLTILNLFWRLPNGEATYIPYDPVGALVIGQGLAYHIHQLLAAPVTVTSGLWAALIGLILRVFGDGFWQLNLMAFWHSAALVSLACWIGRRFSGARGVLCLVVATAMLPPLCFTLVGSARDWLLGTVIQKLLWPAFSQEIIWHDWSNQVLKPDLLAGTLVAWSIALIVIDPVEVSKRRFVASGACLALAILAKGHFFPVYLAGWGTALFVTAMIMGERAKSYVGRSYWALLILAPVFVTWGFAGGAQGAFSYLHWMNPLQNSAAYQRPDLGIWFFAELAPAAFGLCAQLAILLIIFVYLPKPGGLTKVLTPISGILSASTIMALPVVLNRYGKNFSMILPVFVMIWLAILVLTARGFALLNSRQNRWVMPIWLAPFAAVTALGVWAHARTLPTASEVAALTADRAALADVSSTILSLGAHNVLSPNTYTGFPTILSYELTRQARPRGLAVPGVFNVYWDKDNTEAEHINRGVILSADAVVWVPGGPERFPFLGEFQSHVYSVVDKILTGENSAFKLVKTIDIAPEGLVTVYFQNNDRPMKVQVYARK